MLSERATGLNIATTALLICGGFVTYSMVEIVHESMLHGWPTLRRWLDDNQDDAAFLEQLRNAT